MIFPIYTYGEDILRKKAEDVDLNDVLLPSFISDMFETIHNANGSGLAAPQVGCSKRVIIIEEEISDGVIFKMIMLNPKLLSISGPINVITEGCLSFPDIQLQIPRHSITEIEWYDENKQYNRRFFIGIESRIIQHEIDHLDGIVFIDKINLDERLKIFMKLEDIKNKKVSVKYPIK